ncbi:hypothetical protein U1Q18_048542 [Sarracenia purpurea var. burkii]
MLRKWFGIFAFRVENSRFKVDSVFGGAILLIPTRTYVYFYVPGFGRRKFFSRSARSTLIAFETKVGAIRVDREGNRIRQISPPFIGDSSSKREKDGEMMTRILLRACHAIRMRESVPRWNTYIYYLPIAHGVACNRLACEMRKKNLSKIFAAAVVVVVVVVAIIAIMTKYTPRQRQRRDATRRRPQCTASLTSLSTELCRFPSRRYLGSCEF